MLELQSPSVLLPVGSTAFRNSAYCAFVTSYFEM